jgi:hypothetical protein
MVRLIPCLMIGVDGIGDEEHCYSKDEFSYEDFTTGECELASHRYIYI